ncbi:MAG: hypothetical protein WCK96_15545 [Methylococcales bacterium]
MKTLRCRLKEQPFGCLELGRQKTRSLRKSKLDFEQSIYDARIMGVNQGLDNVIFPQAAAASW